MGDEVSTDSEFAVQVVRVTGVSPHPGADRLDLVGFRWTSGPALDTRPDRQVVSVRGEFRPGDLAVYVSVDAVVPLSGPEGYRWAFLRARLDAKGKDHYRIRAARIRGVYSEGLLAAAPRGAEIGQDLADMWGITKWESPEERAAAAALVPKKAGKRPSEVERLVPQYSVLSLRKVPRLFSEGEPVVVTEKIHGTNFRFGWVRLGCRWQFVFGSHRVIKSEHPPWYRALWNRVRGVRPRTRPGWYGEDLWAAAVDGFDLRARTWDMRGAVLYGELYGRTESGKKIQDLTYGADGPRLRVFDAYWTRERTWMDPLVREINVALLGLAGAPVLYRGPYEEHTIRSLAEGQTTAGATHVREGVVVESTTGERRKAKWVGEGYRLREGA